VPNTLLFNFGSDSFLILQVVQVTGIGRTYTSSFIKLNMEESRGLGLEIVETRKWTPQDKPLLRQLTVQECRHCIVNVRMMTLHVEEQWVHIQVIGALTTIKHFTIGNSVNCLAQI